MKTIVALICILLVFQVSHLILIQPSRKEVTINALEQLFEIAHTIIDTYNKIPPIRSSLQTKKALALGSFCVYNSECSGCDIGYSQQCIANRCQCFPVGHSNKNNYTTHLIDCIITEDGLSQLVYFDRGIHTCKIDTLKNTTKIELCENHFKMTSVVDGKTYCLNAIDAFDMICTENRMCQEALNDKAFIGFCINGICHAMSTRSYEKTISSIQDCTDNFTDYCLERNYTYVEPIQARQEACSSLCLNMTGVSGIASSYRDLCQCFSPTSVLPNHID